MPSDTILAMILSFARQALTSVGAALVAGGYMTDTQTADFVGGGLVVVSIVWGLVQKYNAAHKSAVRELVAAKTGETAAPVTIAVKESAEAVIAGKSS